MNCKIWLFEYRCSQRICDCEACVSQPDHFLLKGGYFRNGFTRRRGHKHAYTQPFHHLPSPPAPVQLITISTNQTKRKKRQKTEREWRWRGGNAELEECHFLFTTKRGEERVSQKVSGCLTPSLLPGCCQPPRAMMEGQTHTSFKNLPASLAFVAARHIFIDDSVNVHDRHKSTSCISEGFLWIRKDSCCRNFFSNDVLGHFCFTRQNTLQGSCFCGVYEAISGFVYKTPNSESYSRHSLCWFYVALQNVRHHTN